MHLKKGEKNMSKFYWGKAINVLGKTSNEEKIAMLFSIAEKILH